MANQRKLERAKEKRETRYKDQLDSISVSDAEQRFAKVQLNKATNVSQNVYCTTSVEWFVSKCWLNIVLTQSTPLSQDLGIMPSGIHIPELLAERCDRHMKIMSSTYLILISFFIDNCRQNCTGKDCKRSSPSQDAAWRNICSSWRIRIFLHQEVASS